VTITISAADRHSEVEVTYQLTALTGPVGPRLREFPGPYPAYLQSWQDAITARLRTAGTRPATTATDMPHLTSPGRWQRGRGTGDDHARQMACRFVK